MDNNVLTSDSNRQVQTDQEESMYHQIYSLESLDYYLRHPDKLTDLNPIRSEFPSDNILNKTLQSNINNILQNVGLPPTFYPKFSGGSGRKIYYSTNGISVPELISKKDPVFTEFSLPKLKHHLKRSSLLSDTPFSSNPPGFYRRSSQNDMPVLASAIRNNLRKLVKDMVFKNEASHGKSSHKVFDVQQVSLQSSQPNHLRDLLPAINKLFNKIASPFESKTIENLPPLQVQHSNPLQLQSLAKSAPNLSDENDYLAPNSNQGTLKKEPKQIYNLSSSLFGILQPIINNHINEVLNTENTKGDDDVPNELMVFAKKYPSRIQLSIPSSSKDITQRLGLSLGKTNKHNFDNVSFLGKNWLSELGKPINFSPSKNVGSVKIKSFEFSGTGSGQTGVTASANNFVSNDISSSIEDSFSPSTDTTIRLTENIEKPITDNLISQEDLHIPKQQSPESISNTKKRTSPESSSFNSILNLQGSENLSLENDLNTPPYFDTFLPMVKKMFATFINKHKKNHTHSAQSGHNITENVENKLVGNSEKLKNPDCKKGSSWISKCHSCTCSDDGFPECKIIHDCVLPPLGT